MGTIVYNKLVGVTSPQAVTVSSQQGGRYHRRRGRTPGTQQWLACAWSFVTEYVLEALSLIG